MPKSTQSRKCRPRPPAFTTFACFDELRQAIDILNSENPKPARTYCSTGCLKKEAKAIIDKQTMYYLSLIKQAVAKHRWKHVCQLLLAYIDQPKDDKIFTKHIFNVTLIYLLNDPVSKENGTLDEFLQLAVSCQNDEDRSKLLKKIMMMPENLK